VKAIIYQLMVRLFGNVHGPCVPDGTLAANGCGKFADIDRVALGEIRRLGATHVWLTGVLRQATLTDYGALGMPADDPDVVKGRAGSFYAVRDYYDVCPDYAQDPRLRMAEFERLVARVHDAGMKAMIDIVPNHVARGYRSVIHPERDFGRGDDQSRFFARDNSFYYLTDPPGQQLVLQKPPDWNPAGVVFDGRFAPEDGGPGRVPRASGNNVTSPAPSQHDWYETVKLNYGFNFADPPASSYDPPPRTWLRMDEIIAYWQAKGIDGFRVDFAHYVPPAAWRYLLSRARARDEEVFMVAEAYDDLLGLLRAGFDAVYHDAAYDTLKSLHLGQGTHDDLDRVLGSLDDDVRGRFIHYVENHDERRIASPQVRGAGADASGFGSMDAGRQIAPLLYLYSQGPVIFYNGQEVGEPAAEAAGFGGSGRTSIFDYGSMPELARWVNGHRYDGGGLSEGQLALRSYYADLLALCQAPEVVGGRYWGLRHANDAQRDRGVHPDHFAFARFEDAGGSLVVVVANFGAEVARGQVHLPQALLRASGLTAFSRLAVWRVLDGGGRSDVVEATIAADALAQAGFVAAVAPRTTHVYRIGAVVSSA